MKIRLGYVSVSITLSHVTASSLMTYTYYKKLGEEEGQKRLDEIIKSNFSDLEKILYYNYKNDIYFYRLTSNLIPLSTHPEVNYEVYHRYQTEFRRIGKLVKQYHIRIDTHPNAFCVLNSIHEEVVNSSINILRDQYFMFQAMKIPGKIILHVGSGTYGKKAGINRFIKQFRALPSALQACILLENDDKLYHAEDVLMICEATGIPMVLDYHHHICNPCQTDITELLPRIYATWEKETEPPKMHYSSPKSKKEKRSHSEYIVLDDFVEFLRVLKQQSHDVDVMLEAKAKDDAIFHLVRGLKYKNITVEGTTIFL